MEDHGDVALDTDRGTLLALADSIAGVAIDDSGDVSGGHGVWVKLRDGECLQIGANSVGLALRFEVFPLFIGGIEAFRTRMIAVRPMLEEAMSKIGLGPLPPIPDEIISTVPFAPWPDGYWRLEVLQRRDWIADPDLMGSDFERSDELAPGELPRGTLHASLVAPGLLFSFASGERLLVASADWPPGTLFATRDAVQIDDYLKPCFRIDARKYAETLPA